MSIKLKRRAFVGAFLLAMACASAGHAQTKGAETIQAHSLTSTVSISEQPSLAAVANAGRQGFATVIDLRPDGEAADQPSSAEVGKLVREQGLRFFYVPVANGAPIPASAVAQLEQALAGNNGPVLMYCRSGKRAARTWSLVEASRTAGMEPAAILAAVKAAGQSADDLETVIRERHARRVPAKE